MSMFDAILLAALGFAPTFGALELVWRMSRQIARRGEPVIAK
jgi:hypothetical protein